MSLKRLAPLCACVALAVPAAALGARDPGTVTFNQTFPVASKLCAKADAGQLGKKLAPHTAEVKAACAKLQNAFTTAQNNFKTNCAAAMKRHPKRPRCPGVRRQFSRQVESARRQFWNTIRGLRGGGSVKPDKPIPQD